MLFTLQWEINPIFSESMKYLGPNLPWLLALLFLAPTMAVAKSSPGISPGLQAANQQASQQIEVIKEKGKPVQWRAYNAANRLKLEFDGNGVVAHSQEGEWRLRMELTQLGSAEQLKPVRRPKVTVDGNRLTYDRGAIQEWYINDSRGLEQGFTLNDPHGKEDIVLQLVLEGNVKPELIENGKAVQFVTPQGKTLRYKGLKAWDANGQNLNVIMVLKNNQLQLKVTVADAAYPITIDPLLTLVEAQKLPGPKAEEVSPGGEGAGYGVTVALSDNTALVGVPTWYGEGEYYPRPGIAYVFTRNEGVWTEQARLIPPEEVPYTQFGLSVALTDDTAIVTDGSLDSSRSNSIYVFTRKEGAWNFQARLIPPDLGDGLVSRFGVGPIALSSDTLVVGVHGDASPPTSVPLTSVVVFTRSGDTWIEQAKLIPSDVASRVEEGLMPIAFSDETLALSAFKTDSPSTSSSNVVYIYSRVGDTWIEQAKLTSSDVPEGVRLGGTVAYSGDTILWLGVIDDGGVDNDTAVAHVFTRNGESWSYQDKLTLPSEIPKCFSNDQLSDFQAAISGEIAVIQAICTPKPDVVDGGASVAETYIYTRSGATWTGQAQLMASDSTAFAPGAIAISNNTVLLGKYIPDGESAYAFDLSSVIANPTEETPNPENPDEAVQSDQGSSDSGGGSVGYLFVLLLGFMRGNALMCRSGRLKWPRIQQSA
jgi:hypothetical protein